MPSSKPRARRAVSPRGRRGKSRQRDIEGHGLEAQGLGGRGFSYHAGRIVANGPNTTRAVRAEAERLGLCFNVDDQQMGFVKSTPWSSLPAGKSWRRFTDEDYTFVQEWLDARWQVAFPITAVRSAVKAIAREAPYNPVGDWLRGLEWDGVDRFSSFWGDLGAEDQPVESSPARVRLQADYYRLAARLLFLSIVWRRLRPGSQYDVVVVLESLEQGIRKTELIRAIAGNERYYELSLSAMANFWSEREVKMQVARSFIVDLGELGPLDSFRMDALKQFITAREDNFRRPWNEFADDVPRQCVLIASSNRTHYLSDTTGNRRWLPVRLATPSNTPFNLGWLRDNREQLFAQAVADFHAGVRPVISCTEGGEVSPALAEYVLEQQSRREIGRGWEHLVSDFLARHYPHGGRVSAEQILRQGVGLTGEKLPSSAFRALRGVMLGLKHKPCGRVSVEDEEGGKTKRQMGYQVLPSPAESAKSPHSRIPVGLADAEAATAPSPPPTRDMPSSAPAVENEGLPPPVSLAEVRKRAQRRRAG